MKHIIRTPEQLAAAIYDSYSKGYNPDDGTTVKGRKNMGDYEWVNRPGTTKAVVNGEEVEQINSEDKFVIGYSVPHSTGGLSNTFRYKGLSLNVYLDWAIGHTIRHAQMARQFINTFTGNTALNAGVLDTWSPRESRCQVRPLLFGRREHFGQLQERLRRLRLQGRLPLYPRAEPRVGPAQEVRFEAGHAGRFHHLGGKQPALLYRSAGRIA